MSEFTPAPEWQVDQWFNTKEGFELAQLRGKVVVLHAFQMLCPACVSHAVPQAERLHRLLDGKEAVVIGLHTVFEHHEAMTPTALAAFLYEYRITHPVAVDRPSERAPIPMTMRRYAFEGTPTLVLIDRQGCLRYRHLGGVDDLALGLMIGRLLDEPSPGAGDPGDEPARR